MIKFKLSEIDFSKLHLKTREDHLKLIQDWIKADEELLKICKEKGIEIPNIIC